MCLSKAIHLYYPIIEGPVHVATVTLPFSTISKMIVLTSLLLLAASTSAFTAPLLTRQAMTTTTTSAHLSASPATPEELFASNGWKAVRQELDSCPVFCCANEQGKPLQYNVNAQTTMPFFYTSIQAAEVELVKAKAEFPKETAEQLGIIPFPLGNAFELMTKNQAAVIPCAIELEAAGAPKGTNPLGQQVPLFCCMEIMQESPQTGKPVLPIFMVREEAKQAMEEAIAADGIDREEAKQFDIVSLSLSRAVEMLATNVEEAPSFQILPPRSSMAYIKKYLDNDVNE
jgi:hypothetical protein